MNKITLTILLAINAVLYADNMLPGRMFEAGERRSKTKNQIMEELCKNENMKLDYWTREKTNRKESESSSGLLDEKENNTVAFFIKCEEK